MNLTEDEKLLINSGLSMVGGVVVGTVQGTYQYLTSGGHVTFGSAVSFAVVGFLAGLGVALRAYVPAHAQQMLADAAARATQLEEALHLATAAQPAAVVPSIQPTPVVAPASPVVIHFNGVPMQIDTNSTASVPALSLPVASANVLPTGNTAGTSAIIPSTIQLTMAPATPTIASTPDLASEDTAVRKSVTIAN